MTWGYVAFGVFDVLLLAGILLYFLRRDLFRAWSGRARRAGVAGIGVSLLVLSALGLAGWKLSRSIDQTQRWVDAYGSLTREAKDLAPAQANGVNGDLARAARRLIPENAYVTAVTNPPSGAAISFYRYWLLPRRFVDPSAWQPGQVHAVDWILDAGADPATVTSGGRRTRVVVDLGGNAYLLRVER